jgi:hypothetical protein
MSWGQPFQAAWRHATPVSQAAARKAVLSPEQAARSLSDEISHSLQLLMYAAEDMQRHDAIARQNASGATMSSNVIRQAMDDVRKGRVPAERSEKHLQQAIREADKLAQSATVPSLTPALGNPAGVTVRYRSLRRQLEDQIADAHSRFRAATGDVDSNNAMADSPSSLPNTQLASVIVDALVTINTIFLEHKSVDDPVAPLPQPASPPSQEANVVCLTPRA